MRVGGKTVYGIAPSTTVIWQSLDAIQTAMCRAVRLSLGFIRGAGEVPIAAQPVIRDSTAGTHPPIEDPPAIAGSSE